MLLPQQIQYYHPEWGRWMAVLILFSGFVVSMPPKFKCDYQDIKMSPMELVLHKALRKKDVIFHQEVEFYGCRNPKTGKQLRYDFYIPHKKMLVEYDGKAYHTNPEVIYRDSVKDKFAKQHKLKLVRLSGGSRSIEIFMKDYFSNVLSKEQQKAQAPKSNKWKNKQKKKPRRLAKPVSNKWNTIVIRKEGLGLVIPRGMSIEEYQIKKALLKDMKDKDDKYLGR